MDFVRDEHRVHLIVYHLVWTPKRRKPVLTGKVANRCKEIINAKCEEKGWEILELAVQPDHIHLFVRVWPSDSAADKVDPFVKTVFEKILEPNKFSFMNI